MKQAWLTLLFLPLLLTSCLNIGCDGMGGRDLTGRLIPDTKVELRLPAGYGLKYSSGKDFKTKVGGLEITGDGGKLESLELESLASPVVDADAKFMDHVLPILLRQQERIQERDRLSIEALQNIVGTLANVVGAGWSPNFRPSSGSSVGVTTPWGPVSVDRNTGQPGVWVPIGVPAPTSQPTGTGPAAPQ